jgi:phosphate transport system protein
MQRHFETELDGLKTSIIKMGSIVEQSLDAAIKGLLESNAEIAKEVIDGDDRINELEIEIDHAILDLLALQQPVAIDLRFILAAQKINNDLERIGDHTVNIAQSVNSMASMKSPLLDLPKMSEIAKGMLSSSIDGFIHQDSRLAKSVLVQDDKIDELNRTIIQEAMQIMKSDSSTIECGMEIIRVSRNLERIGDLSTNIAEEVIFITRAELVKHHSAARKTY